MIGLDFVMFLSFLGATRIIIETTLDEGLRREWNWLSSESPFLGVCLTFLFFSPVFYFSWRLINAF